MAISNKDLHDLISGDFTDNKLSTRAVTEIYRLRRALKEAKAEIKSLKEVLALRNTVREAEIRAKYRSRH